MFLYEGQEKAINFTLRMPLAMKEKIKEIADQEHITPTFFIRNSIEKALREKEQKNTEGTSE
jgi:predicted DNA-binding protein